MTADRRRVLHILSGLYPSGMERMLVSAAPYWKEAGWQADIIGQGKDHPFAENLTSAGYRVDYVRWLRTAAGLGDLARLLRASRPDVIHLHTEEAHGPVSLVARATLPNVGLVRTVHGMFRFRGVTVPRRRLQHTMARLARTRHVAPSQDVADNERENWGLTCQVIENWVADEFSQDSQVDRGPTAVEEPLRVAMVGNCSEVKNHPVVLRAALGLPGVVIVHVGGTSGQTEGERVLVRQLEGQSRLEMLGPRTDVTPILENAQVFAMPSRREGMGVALAEALCRGLPCLISDAPGLRWAAHEPGVLVARDTSDWVAILRRLSDDEAFRSATACAAQAGTASQRERFSARRGVGEYATVYTSTARRRG